jgi:putative tricarboxylic transport membrane protein
VADVLGQLATGFAHVLTPVNLLVLAIGLVLGLLVAVLPGLTLVMGVVLALPFTYAMDITPAIILLTAMYVTGTYGGALTAILFRVPGEPIDVPLLWDGYTMARNGLPAKALGWTLAAAFCGGIVSALVMVALSEPVARIALTLSTPEYFAIIFFGLTSVVSLGGGSITNALISLFLGLLISTVGVEPTYGAERFAFGIPMLADGIEYLLVMVGAYGIGEVFTRLCYGYATGSLGRVRKLRTELPGWREIGRVKATLARGSLVGVIVGLVPGAGATIASFVAYGAEGQYGRQRARLGSGIPEGIVAPQTAATSSVGGAMIPLLTMGIPGSGATAIILGAFLLHGVQPGPQIFSNPEQAQMAYAVFASMFLGVLGMCLLGYFAIKALVRVLEFPEAIVSAFVVMFCFMGAFAARNNLSDLYVITAFGILGFLFERFRFPIAPLVLGAILGPLAESTFMTSMISFANDWTVFFTRPVAGAIMLLSLLALGYPVVRQLWWGRRKIAEES